VTGEDELAAAEQRGYNRAVAAVRAEATRILSSVPHDQVPSHSRLRNHERWRNVADFLEALPVNDT
jgi:hypothetical protein